MPLDRRVGLLGPRRSRDTQLERKTLTRRVRLGTPKLGRGFGIAYLALRSADAHTSANARGA